MERVWYTDDGKIYKAEKPQSPTHAQMNFPTQDILDALHDSAPMTREEMIAKINHPEFQRKGAVLEEIKNEETPST
jgi:hypothetical protein